MAGSFDEEYNALSGRIGVIYDVAQAKGTTYGMYDLVCHQFYTNANSVGTIGGGPDVYVI